MPINSTDEKELEEIYLHVKKLRTQRNSTEEIDKKEISTNSKIIVNKILPDFFSDNISDKVNEVDPSSKMSLKTSAICDLCGEDFFIDENLSGLILSNKFFACEECCKDASNDVLNKWMNTRNSKLGELRPIALWLMQEKNKKRLI